MRLSEADILFLPGLGPPDPGHWQRRWAGRIGTARIVEQRDWTHPALEDWVERIRREIAIATRPVVLIAHGLGVSGAVHAAQGLADTKVRGGFLVAPPDHESVSIPEAARGFGAVPRDPLPFPSLLVASTNDPLCSAERAADLAGCWGSELHFAGEAGGIDAASGHGPWPEGLLMLTRLMGRI